MRIDLPCSLQDLIPEEWRLIYDANGHAFTFAPLSASMNMAVDEAIAISYPESKPTIRFYTWEKPAVSIGYFQRIMPVIDWLNHKPPIPPFSKVGKRGINIVRRPTGGGIVLHGSDITYSVVIRTPAPTRNLIPLFYRQMGQAVIEGLRILGIRNAECGTRSYSAIRNLQSAFSDTLSLCAKTPVEFDVLVIPLNPPSNKGGIKVAGCAARRFQKTLLFQGYISIGHITNMMLQQVTDAMVKGFALALNIEPVEGKLTDGELALAEELNNEKYSRNEWNYKR
ncbi:MAG: lipoate--protein ligase family protein [Candidatus Brocadiales bacterium]